MPDTTLWKLPAQTGERFLVTLRRALGRRCPYCGRHRIFDGYLALRDICPACGVRFEREEGYFLGAYALNLVVAEILGLGLALFLLFRTDLRRLDLIWQEVIAVVLAVAFPVLFFPFSRTVWIAMDLTFHPWAPWRARVTGSADVTARLRSELRSRSRSSNQIASEHSTHP